MADFHKSQAWRRIRLAALKRDGYQCQMSKRYGKNVPGNTVHHALPVADYPQYRLCLWNLVTVSEDWHNKLEDRSNGQLTLEGQQLAKRIAQKNGVEYHGNNKEGNNNQDKEAGNQSQDGRGNQGAGGD